MISDEEGKASGLYPPEKGVFGDDNRLFPNGMKAGQLKDMLKTVPDDAEVVVGFNDTSYGSTSFDTRSAVVDSNENGKFIKLNSYPEDYWGMRCPFTWITPRWCRDPDEHELLPPTVTVLIGFPATGKSRYAKDYVDDYPETFLYSTDDLIEKWAKAEGRTYNDLFQDRISDAIAEMDELQEQAIANKQDIVRDQTNLGSGKRRYLMDMFLKEGYAMHAICFLVTDEDEWRRRLERPGKTIGEDVLERMQESYEVPELCEGFDRIEFRDINGQELEIRLGDGRKLRDANLKRIEAEKQEKIDRFVDRITKPALLKTAWYVVFSINYGVGDKLPNTEMQNWLDGCSAYLQKEFEAEMESEGLVWKDLSKPATKVFAEFFKNA